MPTFEIERAHTGIIIAGLDEVGLGPLAGPIVVCACIISSHNLSDYLLKSINDSKKISFKKREELFEVITNDPNFILSTSVIEPKIIDQEGLSGAWTRGINESISNLRIKPNICIIDGNKKINIDGILIESIIKGDQKSYSIASASIIAKVTRDRIMKKLHDELPQYGFDKHVGYGTKFHMEALKKFGATKHHRKSYAPIAKLLSS